MPEDLGWKEAITEILRNSDEPLHYTDIADRIAAQQLRPEFGATPAASVNATISLSLKDDGDHSPFVRVGRGYYHLRQKIEAAQSISVAPGEPEAPEEAGLINAFGMYWRRDYVLWKNSPQILGQQQLSSTAVDFANQLGVYLLHDSRNVIYVGRTTDQPLGRRLFQHTTDRLNGRWDRFSWFGIYSATDDGSLDVSEPEKFSTDLLIATMEALLIEGLEPPQNRKRGDDFRAVEFLQVLDPSIQKSKVEALIDDLKTKLLGRTT
jgi:hypothetical protein